jgi:uncharacterized membrane protein YiaA
MPKPPQKIMAAKRKSTFWITGYLLLCAGAFIFSQFWPWHPSLDDKIEFIALLGGVWILYLINSLEKVINDRLDKIEERLKEIEEKLGIEEKIGE